MSYVSTNYRSFDQQVVGDGQCVAYVKQAAGAPATAQWGRGAHVREMPTIAEGTAIATFDTNGHYENVPGRSHAAIAVRVEDNGIRVYDQWSGHPVSERVIRFDNAGHGASNDGDAFYIIE